MRTQEWNVAIHLDEDEDNTHAHAVLHSRDGVTVQADGSARRKSTDAQVPEIGEELATARALNALADRLMGIAEKDIQDLAHPVTA